MNGTMTVDRGWAGGIVSILLGCCISNAQFEGVCRCNKGNVSLPVEMNGFSHQGFLPAFLLRPTHAV